MKLTVDSVVNESHTVAISIDGYVPIDVKLVDPIDFPPLYWRAGDGKKSLIELAVLPENGFLSAITLVIMDPDSVHKVDNVQVELLDCEYGFPIVSLGLWQCSDSDDFVQRFIEDFNLDIQVFISPSSILVAINEEQDRTNWIKCSDSFYLGVNSERNITHLLLDNLTQEEIADFSGSII
ncbi:hypothetical protein CH64_1861 [Yersinia rohdei]|uniref:Uncharacterized protein n=1 Tax=Yersinia rohdei TaxID=29485 RepID=A0A0U1HYC1_YERRO|nr:hypothetical protein [Yersinia rohdei]AJJ09660.1 hypothetical protein CH64_1861 [Yersinia rohdei]EEQ00862.1 hypothetical protein yrohd0001_39290 [Yersinia rohdei ATCC 43380]MDN0096970.1 hypothetical protein [Yersinia rohdei]CNF48980.1 Uncharacterised protein [Yersinia rohdei]CNJ56235.1 Uncharacterised protein [Yersinia rohdei]